MLIAEIDAIMEPLKHPDPRCQQCRTEDAEIQMDGYCERPGNIRLCADCALQLVRKVTEDLCALLTKGGRHG